MKKMKLGLIFGGRNGEHEVSLISAWNIFHGLDRKKYDIYCIGIDKKGNWRFGKDESFWINSGNQKRVMINPKSVQIAAVRKNDAPCLVDLATGKKIINIDVFFPITHGTFGEDGCLQGLLEMIDVPYVGPAVLGSAVGMDKEVMKRLLKDAGIHVADFAVLRKGENYKSQIKQVIKRLRFPIFVKPARQGSSVGISKAENEKQLIRAIDDAFQYDTKIILEKMIIGREIECGVMGNEHPIASVPGEIILHKGFYSYQAKYIDADSAVPVPHAKIDARSVKKIQKMAIAVYQILECEGMSRVDFFLTPENQLFVNEINTLPGFTNVSMFPKMFAESGVEYRELLDRLIAFAIERKKRESLLKRDIQMEN